MASQLWACSTTNTEATARAEKPPAVVEAAAQDRPTPQDDAVPEPQPASAPPATAAAPRRVFYDLATHVDHAELRHGDTLLIDFGVRGDAKYTLGGWKTRMRAVEPVDGISAAFVQGAHGDVLLPIHADGPVVIGARVRAPRDGEVTVYFDDQVIGRFKQDRNAYGTLTLELPAEKATRGEHMLRLRGSGMAKLGRESTAIAIDWVSVGKKAHALASLPTFDGKSTSLALTDGFSLGYAFRVPEGARLQGTLSPGQGSLRIRAVRDDLSVSELGSIAAGGPVDVDLGALSGQIVRLDLTAAGDVALEAPRVTIAERAPVVPLKPVRNVLVYLIDTLRADHLKPFNPKTRVKTPGLDELVEKGTAVFTSAHTQENWTKPSVATLLSSLLPWQHEAVTTEAVVPKSVRMLPEMLADLGFHSGAFIANGYVSDKFGFNQGWDTYRNYIREGRPTRAKFLASDVLEWLDKRPKTQPFFLYVHAIDPHVPYRPTTEFISIYDPEPYSGVVDFSGNSTLLEDIKIGKIKLKDRDKVRLEALYDSEISYHDVHFRSIMNALQTRGVADDTLVVLVADHGEEFWDHGSVGHGHSVYEELIRIPMLIRMPGVTREPVWLDNPAGLVDVVPTVFEALGEKVPEGLSGRSLLPLLRGDTDTAPRITVSGFMDGWRTAVVSGVKLIQRTEKRVMLHDLATDPREQTDVAHERPISVRYLRGQLGLALWASEQAGSSVTGPSRRHRAEKTTIDAATAAQLEALGYVGTSRP